MALKRIDILIKEAGKVFSKDQGLANRYVTIARKIAMKVNVRIPPGLRRKFCKHCYTYLKIGENARKRTRNGKIVYYCFKCKKYTRIPFTRERKLRKSSSHKRHSQLVVQR